MIICVLLLLYAVSLLMFVTFYYIFGYSATAMQETFEQCLTEVPKRFITGSVNGQFIGSMMKLAQEIVPLALNNQLQQPQITNIISMELEHQDEEESNINENIEQPIDSIHTSRPSDFRIKSISKSMACESDVHHKHNSDQIDNQQKQQTTAPKSISKLFDEFIADFNASVERYW